jgi:branched-chain amino acid transport system ATP-binding protein
VSLLEIQGVTKRFGGLTAVSEVEATVLEGEILGLIGPNGAGKTTLFNMIAGYYKPNEGKIVFAGRDITGLRPYDICKLGIARTFQTTKPFMGSTVVENVLVGALMQDTRVSEARRIAKGIVEKLGMSRLANAPGHELTVPDRKRLEVARALATGARLLLLDEPMAGLTPTEKAHIITLLQDINQRGVTLIVVEHDMKAIMSLSSHIVLLDHGEKLVDGTPREVTSSPKAIAAYLGDDYVAA